MSKIGQAAASLMHDDMGEPSEQAQAMQRYADEEVERERRKWELSQFTTEELWAEMERRGLRVVVPLPDVD